LLFAWLARLEENDKKSTAASTLVPASKSAVSDQLVHYRWSEDWKVWEAIPDKVFALLPPSVSTPPVQPPDRPKREVVREPPDPNAPSFSGEPWFQSKFAEYSMERDEKTLFPLSKVSVLLVVVDEMELPIVLQWLQPLKGAKKVVLCERDSTTYYVGMYGNFTAAVVRCGSVGSLDLLGSLQTTNEGITHWAPDAVINVGVASGIGADEGQKLGDVLVATDVVTNSVHPKEERPQNETMLPIPPVRNLLKTLFVSAKEKWPSATAIVPKEQWGGSFTGTEDKEFNVHVGSIVASMDGAAINEELLSQKKTEFLSCVGSEMQAWGLYASCVVNNVSWVMVKGICDWGQEKHVQSYKPLAVATAADFVHFILANATTLTDNTWNYRTAELNKSKSKELIEHDVKITEHDIQIIEHDLKISLLEEEKKRAKDIIVYSGFS